MTTGALFESLQDQTRFPFQRIVEYASDGILVVDMDGYVVLSNPAVAQIFQRSQDEFDGELFGFPVASGKSTEISILRKDGAMAVAEMRVSEAYWERDRVFIILLRDITERKRMEDALRHAKEELAALYHCAPLGVIALEQDLRVKLWNPAAESIFGWQHDEVVGGAFPKDVAGAVEHRLSEIDEFVQRGELVRGREIRHVRKDGTPVDLSVSLAPVRDKAGRAAGIMCIVEDISRRLRDAERLRLSGKIFENTQEGIVVTDPQGTILTVNRAFVAVTGYSADEAVGRKPNLLNSGRHDQAFYAEMWRCLAEDGQWHGEIWNRRKNGEIYPEWINISAIHDDSGAVSHYVAIFSDITKVKQNEERLRQLAHFDALTGLPNRFLFQDHAELALAQAARSGKQVAVMFLDLDRFKAINDNFGHRAGDNVLIEAARRLGSALRAGDTLSRFGGDEFNAVLPDLDSGSAAAAVAAKLGAALAHPFRIDGQEFHITTSIGIAIYPQDGTELDQLFRAADAAMYQAKEQGRNAFRFYAADGRDAVLSRRFQLENQLRHALDRGEIAVAYQPEVDVESGCITGMEALMRWRHPELGEIAPDEFIPIAEDIGLISHLGTWVLREACRQNKAWQAAGFGAMWVSVNLSPCQLRDRRLVETVRGVLAETGLEGRWLELELTEGALMQSVDESIGILNELKRLGIRLSIDDFGTGHSSL
ncbi:MAG: PAS domain S-box protein, partial [Rhodocyclales bacterium]|nr:PAS domain S-box protein [Rhodocyclales bacterium]